ncbi:MAG: hypothetical protein ACOYON_08525 [Fimbriimonas sp.]
MDTNKVRMWAEPPSGAGSTLPAGESIELVFGVTNNDDRPLVYSTVIEGLPAEWMPANPVKVAVAPFDQGQIHHVISVPAFASLAEYSFSIQLLAGKSEVWDSPRQLILKVSEPAAGAAVVAPAVVDVPAVVEPVVVEPVAEVPVVEVPVAPVVEVLEPVAIPEPVVAKVEVKEATPEPKPVVPEPTPEPKIVDIADIEPEPAPAPEPEPEPEPVIVKEAIKAAPRPKPAPKPKPVVTPEEEPPAPKIVDFVDPVVTQAQTYDEPKVVQSDRAVVDPRDGTAIHARPGERVLVRFSFRNDVAPGALTGTRTFIIQDDRALPRDWAVLVQDQVNITSGGSGEVSILLQPPLSAEPASYPFAVQTGPLGQPLTPCSLILVVQPMPAVTVTAAKPTSSTWFNPRIPLEVTVNTAGNADTAYRLSVRSSAEPETLTLGALPEEIYETTNWRYVIDREVENLTSPVTGRKPAPEVHKITATRRGIWWFGFRESHKFTVAANPVTDPSNGGKGDNRVTLTAVRYRPWPLPAVIFFPLLAALFVFFGSSSHSLEIQNELANIDGVSYIQASKYTPAGERAALPVDLKWVDGTLAKKVTRLEKDSKARVLSQVEVSKGTHEIDLGDSYTKTFEYVLPGGFLGGGERKTLTALGLRTKDMLLFGYTRANGEQGLLESRIEDLQIAGVSRKCKVMDVAVPADGKAMTTIVILNRAKVALGYSVDFVTIQWPQGFAVTGYNNDLNPFKELTAAARLFPKIRLDDQNVQNGTWDLLTTDAEYPYIRFNLKVAR